MRVFLGPDDRKIAAKPQQQHSSSSVDTDQQPRKKLKSSCTSGNYCDFKTVNMGGGGRLMGGPPGGPEAALKSSGGGSDGEQQQERGSRSRDDSRPGSAAANIARRGRVNGGNNINEGLMMTTIGGSSISSRGRNHNNGPRGAAVAAAASSPHRSTINTVHNIHTNNPNEEEDDEWHDNASKQSSPHFIFLGKSNNDDDDDDEQNGLLNHHCNHHHNPRRLYKSSRSSPSSSFMRQLSSNDTSTTPLLNDPILGRMEDPATMSKTNEDNADDPLLAQFVHLLRMRHKPPLDMVEMDGDGNCLFRAISLQVYGDPSMHLEVRRHCLDFMEREADHFHHFVADEPFREYISRKRREGVHGNHTEIQAMSELYNRSIEVFVPGHGIEPINIFHSEYKSDDADAPIRLCYLDGNHYNAVIDPLVPTAGLGLGLPGLQPGLADKLQLEKAKKISDESAMEEKTRIALEESNRVSKAREEIEMKEALRKSNELAAATTVDSDDDVYKKKAMYLSEIEAADFDLEQAVLASSLQSYRQAEQESKPSSSRRGDGRRSRFNSSPRGQRSLSNSPVYRTTATSAAANTMSNRCAAAAASSSVASLSSTPTPAAYVENAAPSTTDEYPASVQELVMNGFELSKVLHAYDLIGDNFDDLLSFLLSSATA